MSIYVVSPLSLESNYAEVMRSFWLMSFLEIKASNVFGLDVTLPCFVKLLVCLMLFLSL